MKLNRYLVAALAVLSFSSVAMAQDPLANGDARNTGPTTSMGTEDRVAKNGLFLELGGSGLIYSLNYERFFLNDLAARVGVEYFGVSATNGSSSGSASWLAVPIMAEFTGLRKGNHAFELSAGATIHHLSATASTFDAFSSGSGTMVAGSAFLGYRYQDPGGGMMFRAGFSPQYFFGANTGAFIPWFSLSVGYGF